MPGRDPEKHPHLQAITTPSRVRKSLKLQGAYNSCAVCVTSFSFMLLGDFTSSSLLGFSGFPRVFAII